MRWQNALIASAGVLLGAWWATQRITPPVVIAAASALALAAVANAWNDAADVEIDRIAHPERPLPSGRLTLATARWIAFWAAGVGVLLAALAHPALGAFTVPIVALMFLYSPRLARRPLIGNAVVAGLASLPFLYGAWAAGAPARGLWLAAVAAPLHLARELAKDLDDRMADAAVRRTLPVAHGPRMARGVGIACTGAWVLLCVPLMLLEPLFAIALVPAMLLAFSAARRMLADVAGAPLHYKLAMVAAMAALAIAPIGRAP